MSRTHSRERLFCRLDSASRGRLVWVHGPPGAGKTVLVSSWLEQRMLRALWLQLDCGDADEATLFHYLGLASRKMLPHASIPTFSLQTLATLGAYSRAFFRALFAARETPMLLVFDDYHTLPEDSAVHASLAEGLEECPASGGVVVMSRHEPPATWTRLRMGERLDVIRPEELLLSREESAAIVALRTGHHDPETVTRLHGHSGGWAAGLVLLLEAGNEPGHFSADESVFDFLAEEVLAGVDDETRAVLLATSLLPDVAADLAVRLSGVARAGHVLSKLARRGYFTANLEGTSSYRYHPLFRQFLRQRASKEWGHRILGVQAHAARLLAEAGRLEDALELASKAQAWDQLEQLVLELAPELLRTGRARTLRGIISALPSERKREQPWLQYWLGLASRPFSLPNALEALEQAYDAFSSANDAAGITLSWSAIALSYLWVSEHVPEIWVRRLDDVEQVLTRASSPELEGSLAEAAMGTLTLCSPRHPALERWRERAMKLALTSTHDGARFAVGCQLYFTYAFWGLDLPRARLLRDALGPLHRSGRVDPIGSILWLLSESYYHVHAADPDQSIEAASHALFLASEGGYHYWDVALHGIIALAELLRDDMAAAARAIDSVLSSAAAPDTPQLMRAFQHYVCGTYAFYRGELSRAREEAKSAAHIADELGVPLGQAKTRALWAFVAQVSADGPSLNEALRWSEETGYRPGEFACRLGLAAQALTAGLRDDACRHLASALALGREHGIMNAVPFRAGDWSDLCALALDVGIEQKYVQDLIQLRRIPAGERARELPQWPWTARVLALQGFTVQAQSTRTKTRKSQKMPLALLQLLVEVGPRGGRPDQLAAELWPDADGDRAIQAFHTTLHRLRALLGDPESILHQDGRFTLNAQRVYVDAWALEHLLERLEYLEHKRAQQSLLLERDRLLKQITELWDPLARSPHAIETAYLRRLQKRLEQVVATETTADGLSVFLLPT